MTTMGALEMWAWSMIWGLVCRLFLRMVRNAKVDLVSEVTAFCIEGLRAWGVPLEQVQSLVKAAYEAKAEDVPALRSVTKLALQSGSPSLAPSGPDFSPPAPRPDREPSTSTDRPAAPGTAVSNPAEKGPDRPGGGS